MKHCLLCGVTCLGQWWDKEQVSPAGCDHCDYCDHWQCPAVRSSPARLQLVCRGLLCATARGGLSTVAVGRWAELCQCAATHWASSHTTLYHTPLVLSSIITVLTLLLLQVDCNKHLQIYTSICASAWPGHQWTAGMLGVVVV